MLIAAGRNFTGLYFLEGVHKLFTAVGFASAVGGRLFSRGGAKKKPQTATPYKNETISIDAESQQMALSAAIYVYVTSVIRDFGLRAAPETRKRRGRSRKCQTKSATEIRSPAAMPAAEARPSQAKTSPCSPLSTDTNEARNHREAFPARTPRKEPDQEDAQQRPAVSKNTEDDRQDAQLRMRGHDPRGGERDTDEQRGEQHCAEPQSAHSCIVGWLAEPGKWKSRT
jgi:hypothetical protein